MAKKVASKKVATKSVKKPVAKAKAKATKPARDLYALGLQLRSEDVTDNRKIIAIDHDAFRGKGIARKFSKVRKGMTVAKALEAGAKDGLKRFDIACWAAPARERVKLGK